MPLKEGGCMGLCLWRGRVVCSKGCWFKNRTTEENTNPPIYGQCVCVHTVCEFVFMRRRMGGVVLSVVKTGRS